MEVDDVLQHYGIPGMHWVQRHAERKVQKTATKDAKRQL